MGYARDDAMSALRVSNGSKAHAMDILKRPEGATIVDSDLAWRNDTDDDWLLNITSSSLPKSAELRGLLKSPI
jgi:hypothetical protein